LLIELPTIAEAFAARFDELLGAYPERDDFRATWSQVAVSCTQLSSLGN